MGMSSNDRQLPFEYISCSLIRHRIGDWRTKAQSQERWVEFSTASCYIENKILPETGNLKVRDEKWKFPQAMVNWQGCRVPVSFFLEALADLETAASQERHCCKQRDKQSFCHFLRTGVIKLETWGTLNTAGLLLKTIVKLWCCVGWWVKDLGWKLKIRAEIPAVFHFWECRDSRWSHLEALKGHPSTWGTSTKKLTEP